MDFSMNFPTWPGQTCHWDRNESSTMLPRPGSRDSRRCSWCLMSKQHCVHIHGPRAPKTSEEVGPFWKYRLLRTFYQNNGSPAKTLSFWNKPSFCVHLPCEACEVIYFDLLGLQTQPLTMKLSENQRSRLTSNQPMPANINKRAGSGLRFA